MGSRANNALALTFASLEHAPVRACEGLDWPSGNSWETSPSGHLSFQTANPVQHCLLWVSHAFTAVARQKNALSKAAQNSGRAQTHASYEVDGYFLTGPQLALEDPASFNME